VPRTAPENTDFILNRPHCRNGRLNAVNPSAQTASLKFFYATTGQAGPADVPAVVNRDELFPAQ